MNAQSAFDPAQLVLGSSTAVLEPDTSAANRLLAERMVQQAARRVRIISRHLDPAIYDTEEFVEACRRMVLDHSRSRLEILVKDVAPILRRSHRLLALTQRLSSFMEVRRTAPQHDAFNAAYLIVDDRGFVERTFADRYEGTACFNDPRTCRSLNDTFEEMWQLAEPDSNLRRLY